MNSYGIDVKSHLHIIGLLPLISNEVLVNNAELFPNANPKATQYRDGLHLTKNSPKSESITLSDIYYSPDNPLASSSFDQSVEYTANSIFCDI